MLPQETEKYFQNHRKTEIEIKQRRKNNMRQMMRNVFQIKEENERKRGETKFSKK